MKGQGKDLETLGTILASAGWLFVAVSAFLFLGNFLRFGPEDLGLIALSFLSAIVAGMALAGLGHLLRAVAQLGRNMHRLAAMIQQR